MATLREIVAQNIRTYRLRAGLSQADLCNRLVDKGESLNVKHLSQIENHGQNLTLETLEKLAEGLRIAPHQLLMSGAHSGGGGGPLRKELPGLEAAIRLLQGHINSAE